MKNILFLVLLLFLALTFGLRAAFAADCFLFEGTYVGAALLNGKESRPLFFVVANKHIAGFFAPEDQTHPGGASINQTELTNNSFILSLTADDKILVKYATSTTLDGKAKLIEVMGSSGIYHGYYTNPNSSRDFLNVGEDGGAVLTVTAGRDYVFAFGKINSEGKFVQVFPEGNNDPQVNITISGNTASFSVLTTGGLSNGLSNSEMQKTEITDCTGSSMSENSSSGGSVSSGGAPPGEPIFVKNFKDALKQLKLASKEFKKVRHPDSGEKTKKIAEVYSKQFQKIERQIESAIKQVAIVCQIELIKHLGDLESKINFSDLYFCKNIESDTKPKECTEEFYSVTEKLSNAFQTLKDISTLDSEGNGTPDICEE